MAVQRDLDAIAATRRESGRARLGGFVLPPHPQLPQRRDWEPSTGRRRPATPYVAAGGPTGRYVLVGAEGCFSATRGRAGIDDTPRSRLGLMARQRSLCVC